MGDSSLNLVRLAKGLLGARIYSKLRQIKDPVELAQVARVSISAALEREFYSLEDEVKSVQESDSSFNAHYKLLLVPSKILHFKASGDESDYHKVIALFKDIRKEMKYV